MYRASNSTVIHIGQVMGNFGVDTQSAAAPPAAPPADPIVVPPVEPAALPDPPNAAESSTSASSSAATQAPRVQMAKQPKGKVTPVVEYDVLLR